MKDSVFGSLSFCTETNDFSFERMILSFTYDYLFWNFEISLNFLLFIRLKSFSYSWSNLFIWFPVLKSGSHFTCRVKTIPKWKTHESTTSMVEKLSGLLVNSSYSYSDQNLENLLFYYLYHVILGGSVDIDSLET